MVPLKLAILGTRGVPANYGGFETFAAELSTRLVQRGHEVSVYCRDVEDRQSCLSGQAGSPVLHWNGVRRIVLPAAKHKYLETVSHAFLSAIDALRRDFDAVLVCNAANAFVLPILRAGRMKTAINVDGIERKRRKWNVLGRAVYSVGEAMSVSFAQEVVADAEVIARYYREHYAAEPVTIPYGSDFPEEEDSDIRERLGVRDYILYVSRFEPENNPLEVVRAYERLARGESQSLRVSESHRGSASDASSLRLCDSETLRLPPLVMVGKGLYAHDLVAELQRHASDKILFPGAIYGRDYRTLQRNALLYIQATEVGGTHPALIEAMASGGVVLAHDTPENREVGGDAVGYFSLRPTETLSGMLREWLADARIREIYRTRARRRAGEHYSWNRVTDAYERLFASL
jgi:glycosyltransferase involved in cell wall biosynthesis